LVDRKLGGDAAVVDIESVDAENPEYAAVVKLFDAYNIWALPVILIDGKEACWGTIDSKRIEQALDRVLHVTEGLGS